MLSTVPQHEELFYLIRDQSFSIFENVRLSTIITFSNELDFWPCGWWTCPPSSPHSVNNPSGSLGPGKSQAQCALAGLLPRGCWETELSLSRPTSKPLIQKSLRLRTASSSDWRKRPTRWYEVGLLLVSCFFYMCQNVVVVQKTYGKAKCILYIVNNLPENTKTFSTLDIPSMSVALSPKLISFYWGFNFF